MIDNETRAVRAGEEIDGEKLSAFLRREEFGHGGDLSIEQFPAGSSNLTYLLKIGDDEFVLRRPPFGNTVRSAHDMRREFEVLSRLSAVYRQAPKPLLYCENESVIGSQFYLMERRCGLIIRGDTAAQRVSSPTVREGAVGPSSPSDALDRLHTDQDYRLQVCRSFITNLADLHALDYKAAGLQDLGRPEGYCKRQVEGWTTRYRTAKTHEHPELESAIRWLDQNIPPESAAALVHNDYKFDNVMLDPGDLTRIVAVLDWEMVTVGDPLMDLGTTLGYWVGPEGGEAMLKMPFNPRVLRETVTRRDLVEMYAGASGRDVSNILYYYVFGLFKIAGIAQQIYARYAKGFTKDERFARFDQFVSGLGRLAAAAIEKGRI